ncbi:MAG: hypothetical protein ACT4OP_04675 [Actinomycetota bacterium]
MGASEPTTPTGNEPEQMRRLVNDYIRTVHLAYTSQAKTQPPAVQGRMLLLGDAFTVVAAAVRNLHVIATRERLGPLHGQEVEWQESTESLSWTIRFFDPIVLPALGFIDESVAPAPDMVRRALGITTHLYHLIVQPGSQLTPHHAGHAGSGLANSHVSAARDFVAIRAVAKGRESLVDEMEGAAGAGLIRAQALLARQIVPHDPEVGRLAENPMPDADVVRKALLSAVRGPGSA